MTRIGHRQKVIITGGTGFIGRALCTGLLEAGYSIVVVSRTPEAAPEAGHGRVCRAVWDRDHPDSWLRHLPDCSAVVNLAGDNIASSLRWSAAKKERILASRLSAGQAVAEALSRTRTKPAVLVQASAIGYYGNRCDEKLEETSAAGRGYLAEVAVRWESCIEEVRQLGVRVAVIRTGVVLGRDGGFLARATIPFRCFMGGHPSSGRQWISWIHLADEVAAIRFLIENSHLAGPFNLTAPNPLTARDFFKLVGTVLHRPSWLPVPGFALSLLLGELARELLLSGQRVLPRRLLDAGFVFGYPQALSALQDVLGRHV